MTEEQKNETQNINPEELFPKDIYTFMKMILGSLSSQVWVFLGLMPHPATQKIEKDVTQAKVALDTIDFIYNQISSKMEDNEKKAYEELLGNLKLNFIEQSR